ncbi:MAG: phenylalanine--tRNA ligase subunit beta [Simkaniaceae bacterium]|nr:phenylalanine--tRNA ligase subunit beta [Simkaniaceae bacterium]
MKIPLSWLKEFISLEESPEEIADILTLAGLEVDAIIRKELPFSGVVVGKVVACEQHPDAERLKVATVSDGSEEVKVVCGGANCREGLTVAFAKVGAKVGEIKIKRAKLRGVESFGMLCAAEELGLEESSEGIMELDDLKLGLDLRSLHEEIIFEISLTPNLGHCMSVLGVARELGALLGRKVRAAELRKPSGDMPKTRVSIDTDLCSLYGCLEMQVEQQQSPTWMKTRLEDSGVRPVSWVVDVLNYVMLEIGQPMHAFDLDKLSGEIRIAQAGSEMKIETLDDVTRELSSETLLIFDGKKPAAIAGIMGGAESAISDGTTKVLLEAANFSATFIRKTSRSLGLRSESSARFEKGIDPQGPERALARAAELLGGNASAIHLEGAFLDKKPVKLRTDRINKLLGTQLSPGEVEELLKRLEMQLKKNGDNFTVTPPSYRNDIVEEIDLVEEVARIYGYNNIPSRDPGVCVSEIPHHPMYLFENAVRERLVAEGLQEFLTCDLISPSQSKIGMEKSLFSEEGIKVLHAKSVDQSVLRATFLPGLIQSIKINQSQGQRDIAAFEVGKLHFKDGEEILEKSAVALIAKGQSSPLHWEHKPREIDFYDLKGHVENFLEGMGAEKAEFRPSKMESFHPGRQAEILISGVRVGVIGEVHPGICDVDGRLYYAQLDLHDLMEHCQPRLKMDALPMFPGSDRDLTLTTLRETAAEEILSSIRNVPSKLLKDVKLIDLYRSEKLGGDRQNLTLRFFYRSDKATIKQEAVDREHARLSEEVKKFAIA